MSEILLGAGLAVLFFSGGLFVKAKVEEKEDEDLVESDEFTKWDALFKKYGLLNGVDWTMMKAIAMNESSLGQYPTVARGLASPDDVEGSKSQDGLSWGIMQMTVTTAKDYDNLATAQKLNHADYSVRLASLFLSSLLRTWKDAGERKIEWIVKSYNQGAGNTRKESRGEIDGYAEVYWERYQRNRKLITTKQGV